MSDTMSWLVIAGVVVVLELCSGTFYLLMIAIGLAAGAIAAYGGCSHEVQLIVAAVVAAFSTVVLRRSRFGVRGKVVASRDPNVNLDIGQVIEISEWQHTSMGLHKARAMHRGALWDVEYVSSEPALPGRYTIVEIRGSQLIVEPKKLT